MTPQEIQTTLAVYQWREKQLLAISEQIEDAFPDLEVGINAKIADMSIARAAVISVGFKKQLTALIREWAEAQTAIALARAEAELDEVILELEKVPDLGSELRHLLVSAAPVLLGSGLLAATVAAVPVTLAFGVKAATVFLLVPISMVSIPVIVTGVVGAGVLAASGATVLGRYAGHARTRLARNCAQAARVQVFGKSGSPDERSILNDIQVIVLRAGNNRLKETT